MTVNSNIVFKNNLYDPSTVGVYIVTINYHWNQSPTETTAVTVTLIDPCILGVVPLATIPSTSANNSDIDSTESLAPAITNTKYQLNCVYSISIEVTKSNTPDTSPIIVLFTPMVNAKFLNINSALVTFHSSVYDKNYAG